MLSQKIHHHGTDNTTDPSKTVLQAAGMYGDIEKREVGEDYMLIPWKLHVVANG